MGIANIINNSTTTSGGEIVRELVNSSDGAGLHFDGGSPGYIDIASPPDLGTKFSFEFVFKATTWTSGDYKFLLDFGGGSGRFIIGTNNSDNNLKIFDNVGYKDTGVVIFDDLDVHHVVVTVDGTSALVYDNGNQVGSATISASHGIDTATDAAIATNIFYSSNNAVTGTLYRCRFYNKALTSAEVQTAFERADVDFIDQHGSQTELVTNGDFATSSDWTGSDWVIGGGVASIDGSQTGSRKLSQNIGASADVRYRVTYTVSAYTTGQVRFLFGSSDGGTYRNAAGTYTEEIVTTASGTFHLQANASFNGSIDNVSVVRIGCVSDYDLAFANPTQSLTVQDRSGAADGTASTSGVTQVQKLVQLNATAARIGTTAATPADGTVKVGDALTLSGPTSYGFVEGGSNGLILANNSGNDCRILVNDDNTMQFNTSSATRLTLDSSGNADFTKLVTVTDTDGRSTVKLVGAKTSDGNFGDITARNNGTSGQAQISFRRDGADDATAILFYTNTGGASETEKMRISSTGDVGIACTPEAPFHTRVAATTGSSPLEVARLEVRDSGVNTVAGIGPKLSFYPPANIGSYEGAAIAAKKESDTDSATSTTLSFSTCKLGDASPTERMTINSVGLASFSAGVTVSGGITTLGSFSELTINTGQITITQSVHTVDTESDAATDDLDTINGGSTGSILVLKSVLGSRHVVLKDGTDNLRLNGDCELGTSNDTITLMKVSTVWREMSRSLNN